MISSTGYGLTSSYRRIKVHVLMNKQLLVSSYIHIHSELISSVSIKYLYFLISNSDNTTPELNYTDSEFKNKYSTEKYEYLFRISLINNIASLSSINVCALILPRSGSDLYSVIEKNDVKTRASLCYFLCVTSIVTERIQSGKGRRVCATVCL